MNLKDPHSLYTKTVHDKVIIVANCQAHVTFQSCSLKVVYFFAADEHLVTWKHRAQHEEQLQVVVFV